MSDKDIKIGILKETGLSELRVSIVPRDISKLLDLELKPIVQSKAGLSAGYSDSDYQACGAKISATASEVIARSDIIVKVSKPLLIKEGQEEVKNFKKDQIVICNFQTAFEQARLATLINKGVKILALEHLPRITRAQSMDILSSAANLAGYRSVIEASYNYHESFPMMTTAAGTIKPAKVLILGCGVAGLQAIATAKRLGAIVTASDVRAEAAEQVMSLGAKYIGVGSSDTKGQIYAKEMSKEYMEAQNQLISKHIIDMDIVITTALIPGKTAPILVSREMVLAMKAGSVIFDLAISNGGNVEGSVANKVTNTKGVKIFAPVNILANMPKAASKVLSTNYINFITLLLEGRTKNSFAIKRNDEIIKACLFEKPVKSKAKKADARNGVARKPANKSLKLARESQTKQKAKQ